MGKSGLYENKTKSCGGFEEILSMFKLVVLGQSGVWSVFSVMREITRSHQKRPLQDIMFQNALFNIFCNILT